MFEGHLEPGPHFTVSAAPTAETARASSANGVTRPIMLEAQGDPSFVESTDTVRWRDGSDDGDNN